MGTSWEYLAAEVRTPAKLYSLNMKYLNRSVSAPVVDDINVDQFKIIRENITRAKEILDLDRIEIVFSQGCFLTIWQSYEYSIRCTALECGISMRKKSQIGILDIFLNGLKERYNISRESFEFSDWNEIDRIRKIRNEILHEGGILSARWKNLKPCESGYVIPMTDDQMESGDIFGPIKFPEDALVAYSNTLACSIEELGFLLENAQCSS